MKIAVTYENGEVFQHFGHTENFKIYTIKDGAVSEAHVEPTQGSGHSALAGFLAERNVDALICGIGQGAKNALAQAGITLYGGVVGKADDAVRALRRHRCDLMDALHESQARVDCLDYLIRRMEEERT